MGVKNHFNIKRTNSGFSLLEVVVGIGVMAIIFWGLFGVFRLSLASIVVSKAKAGGLALASDGMEHLRSLPYFSVGTIGGIPSGIIPQEEIITLNNIVYTRRTYIQYVDDPRDGLGPNDINGITTDYKLAKVTVSWTVREHSHEISAISYIVPKGIETTQGGGTLQISVLDALGQPVSAALVHIENNTLPLPVNLTTYSNSAGRVFLPGAPQGSDYRITVSKNGYSTAQTYTASSENPNPSPAHLSVVENTLTHVTFQIDRVGEMLVRTWIAGNEVEWQDEFTNQTKISELDGVEIVSGLARLAEGESQGAVFSIPITSNSLVEWNEFSWNHTEPSDSVIRYRVYTLNAQDERVVLPNSVLPGNSNGFTSSPVDLSSLSTTTYSHLILNASLEESQTGTSPEIFSWGVSYRDSAVPLGSVPFRLRGEKTIGQSAQGEGIPKFNQTFTTSSSGERFVQNLEWDTYVLRILSTEYDVESICPHQPKSLLPSESSITDVHLIARTPHSLFVTIRNNSSLGINGASVRVFRSGFSETLLTKGCGQVLFSGLSRGTIEQGNPYSLEISADGYQTLIVSDVVVDGQSDLILNLSQ
jgi:type II secretory pathway pseudopilin PulG